MEIPSPFYRIAVKSLVVNENNEFLLIQEDNGRRELPGGGLEHGEEAKEGLQREIEEELGISASYISDTPRYCFTREEKGRWKCNIIYDTNLSSNVFHISNECVTWKYFSPQEAKKLDLYPNVKKFIELYEKSR